jgi:glycosyltransferase involved in cell wall biosynthesis
LRLSIVVPAYNEERVVRQAITELLGVSMPFQVEVIVVDDGSSDGTLARLRSIRDPRLRIVRHPRNRGKGAALKTGAALATGTHILPFDADREYDPNDIPRLVAPIVQGRCAVVFGSRIGGLNTVHQSYRYAMGNRALTFVTNVLFDAALSDLHTCLKLVPLPLFRSLELSENGFGLDTELTAGILRAGIRPCSVPISYYSRTHREGKKIGWRDAVVCVRILGHKRFASAALQVTGDEPRTWTTGPKLDPAPRMRFYESSQPFDARFGGESLVLADDAS